MSEEPRRKWGRWPAEFRQRALERMKSCPNVKVLAQELGVARQLLYLWKQQGEGRKKASESGVALLLNRGFCGWQAVFYHLNRGQYAILPLNRGQTFCHRKEVVLSIAVVFKILEHWHSYAQIVDRGNLHTFDWFLQLV